MNGAPHSLDAECSLLGALLIDNGAIDRMGELSADAFYTAAHSLIFTAIRKQAATGKAWDVITTVEVLTAWGKLDAVGGASYVYSIAKEAVSSANVHRYADIVRDHATRRAAMAAAVELTELAGSALPIAEVMDKVQSRLLAITATVRTDEPRSIGEILTEQCTTIEQRPSARRQGIPTGIPELDEILNGGLHRGNVVVLAARTSMGKTALSLRSAVEAAHAEYGVLFLSMEMVAGELADRSLSAYGRIPLRNVLSGMLTDSEWSGLSRAVGELQDLPLRVAERSGLTIYQVASYARRHKRKYGLDLLVIDYLQLMAGTDPKAKRNAQVEEITRSLKVLAKELGVAILLLSQLNRGTDNARRPKLSDLRDSGSIEQDADVVLFIHREEVDNPDTPWKNYADIYVAKNRQGALGRIGVTYIGEQVRFEPYAGNLPDWGSQAPAGRKGF